MVFQWDLADFLFFLCILAISWVTGYRNTDYEYSLLVSEYGAKGKEVTCQKVQIFLPRISSKLTDKKIQFLTADDEDEVFGSDTKSDISIEKADSDKDYVTEFTLSASPDRDGFPTTPYPTALPLITPSHTYTTALSPRPSTLGSSGNWEAEKNISSNTLPGSSQNRDNCHPSWLSTPPQADLQQTKNPLTDWGVDNPVLDMKALKPWISIPYPNNLPPGKVLNFEFPMLLDTNSWHSCPLPTPTAVDPT